MPTVTLVKVRVLCPDCNHFLGLAGEHPQFDPWCSRCRRLIPIDRVNR